MFRLRLQKVPWLAAAAVACVASIAGLAACPATTTTTLFNPITGLTISSQDLIAGLGCGTAPNQVYKYAAVVTLAGDAGTLPGLPLSGVFDCFEDAQFGNLPTPDGGLVTDYSIAIYAYNAQNFPANALGGCVDLPADAACQGENPATVDMYASHAQWTTTCIAQEFQGVSSVAVCPPLVATGDAGVGDAGPADGAAREGGDAMATDGGDATTGPSDAGSGDGGDAGHAGDGAADAGEGAADGGAPLDASGDTGLPESAAPEAGQDASGD